MADGCGNITTGSTNVCATPFQGGLGSPDLVLVNNDDWSSFTESAATPNLVTAVTLASGASAYAFQGYKISLKPSVDVVEGPDGRNAYIHRQAFIIYANSQVQKNNIQRLAQGRVKSLHENAGKNDDSFEWMGIGVGLQMKAQKIRDLQENGAAYMILLETPTNEPEAKLPQTYLATNYAGTVTARAALLFLPTVTVISDLAISAAGGDAETITGTNFHGSGSNPDVLSVQWVNRVTGALTTQTAVTVASATSLTFTSVALTAGTYNLRVTTTKGFVTSTIIVTVS